MWLQIWEGLRSVCKCFCNYNNRWRRRCEASAVTYGTNFFLYAFFYICCKMLYHHWMCLCFSLFAAEALESKSRDSTTSVYGCEMSHVMSQTAADIVSQSRFSRLVHIINKKSTELRCPGDLPAQLVTVNSHTHWYCWQGTCVWTVHSQTSMSLVASGMVSCHN